MMKLQGKTLAAVCATVFFAVGASTGYSSPQTSPPSAAGVSLAQVTGGPREKFPSAGHAHAQAVSSSASAERRYHGVPGKTPYTIRGKNTSGPDSSANRVNVRKWSDRK